MNDKFSDLYNEFLVYVDKNDEDGARKFLLDNFKNFPDEVQDKLTFVFFEEAVKKEGERVHDIAGLQQQGLTTISQIDKVKKILEEKAKIEEINSKLDK